MTSKAFVFYNLDALSFFFFFNHNQYLDALSWVSVSNFRFDTPN